MHVLQWIAIKDESKEDAFNHVRNNLESYLNDGGTWYDWFVTGGGRWNPNPDSQYDDNDMDMVMSFEEDPFISKVDECIEARIAEFNRYRQYFNEKNVDLNEVLDRYNGQMDFSFDLYDLSKMIEMSQGNWDFNSYFFDMEHHSTNTKYMLDNIASGSVNWYLVPVDFHF